MEPGRNTPSDQGQRGTKLPCTTNEGSPDFVMGGGMVLSPQEKTLIKKTAMDFYVPRGVVVKFANPFHTTDYTIEIIKD